MHQESQVNMVLYLTAQNAKYRPYASPVSVCNAAVHEVDYH